MRSPDYGKTVRPIKVIVFDLDGTLVLSAVDFLEMKKRVMEYIMEHYPSLAEEVDSSSNREVLQRFSRLLPQGALRDREMAELNRIMDAVELEAVESLRPACRIRELILQLRSMGLRVAILTRSCERYTTEVLRRYGISGLLDAVSCRNHGFPVKPDPESIRRLAELLHLQPDEMLLVGDHPMDGQCAKLAGALFVAVSYGSSGPEKLEKFDPIAILDDLDELPRLIRDLEVSPRSQRPNTYQ